jgi:hypothetical protein
MPIFSDFYQKMANVTRTITELRDILEVRVLLVQFSSLWMLHAVMVTL